jgi:hypothetical protein
MKLHENLSGNTPKKKSMQQFVFNENAHSVIVYFNYGIPVLEPLLQLGDSLQKAIEEKGVGTYDGNEIADDDSDGSVYMYGPDADELFKVIKPILEATPFMKGATAVLTFGPYLDGVKQIDIEI